MLGRIPLTKPVTWIGLILLVLGALLLRHGWRWYHETHNRLAAYARTEGQVVALVAEVKDDEDGNIVWHPVVEFTTASGERVQFQETSGFGFRALAPRVGQTVDVVYNPDTPEEAMLASWLTLWFPVVGLGCLGGVALFFGLVLLLEAWSAE